MQTQGLPMPAVWLQARYLTSLGLSCLICKMEVLIALTP